MDRQTTNLQNFVQELTDLVEANLKNEQFGVSELAREMGISRSSLYTKVKRITKKSASRFINEVRLKKAMEILKQTSLTVSEVSYEVGFGSPTYFSKCFHDYYGLSPGEVNEYNERDSDIEPTHQGHFETSKKRRRLKLTFAATTVFILAIVSFIVVKPVSFQKANTEKSIAVLPLKTPGNDLETQILAYGIMEDILTRLSHIKELNVKASISTEKYRNSTESVQKIASELSVSYLLEGSILKDGDKVRVYIQLIDAKRNKHIWSDQYDRDLSGLLSFVTDISAQIAKTLETVLSPEEREQIEKHYTENTKAYNLYLKGRFFSHRRTVEDLDKSIKYFNLALEQDSDYSLAYAGLADTYGVLPFYNYVITWEEAYTKSKENAEKALRIDNSLSEPHVALGGIEMYFKLNWKLAKKELLKAIELDPRNADAYQFYAEYLHLVGRLDEALENINKAIELEPNTCVKYDVRANIQVNRENFDKALEDSKKIKEINENAVWTYWRDFLIYVRLGDDINAIRNFKKYLELIEPEKNYDEQVEKAYAESGIDGILNLNIDRFTNRELVNHWGISIMYAIMGNREQTLEHLEKTFEQFETGHMISLTSIKADINLKFLHDDPRFIAILKKMGLEDL